MAQQQQQHGGNLRNRKHANNNSAAVVVESMDDDHHQNAPVGGEGTPPNDPSTRVVREAEDAPDDAEDDKEEVSDDDDDDQFYLTPMDQRPLLLRLDVGPFLLAYSGLIAWDNAACSEEEAFLLLGISVVSFAFVVVLVLHLALVLWTQWSVPIKADVGFRCCKSTASDQQQLLPMTLWTHCLVQGKHTETDGSTLTGIVPIIQESSEVVVATFQDRIFRCSNRIPDADVSLWDDKGDNDAVHRKPCARRFRPVQYPIHLPFRWYATWKGHDSIHSAVTSGRVYGRNTTTLQLPAFLELLSQQMIAPFFIFQVFCVVLWSLDEYWYYALFTLFALILFESTLAYNRLKSLERLHTISHRNQHQRVWVRRGIDAATKMTWMSIPVAELVPGDWLSLSGSHVHVPADILLLQGSAVCDEALLTGESVPQLKQALDVTASTERTLLNMQDGDQKESLLFAGTNLLVGTPPSEATVEEITPDNGVSGIVLRTGFETVQGNLLRTMAHSTASTDGVHTVDTFVFILLLVLCAIGAAGYVLYEGWNDDRRNRFRLILHVVIIITSVVPPELPMELSLAVTNSVADLMRRSQVFCTEHFRIPWAGEIDVCCFDKTGTL